MKGVTETEGADEAAPDILRPEEETVLVEVRQMVKTILHQQGSLDLALLEAAVLAAGAASCPEAAAPHFRVFRMGGALFSIRRTSKAPTGLEICFLQEPPRP